MEHIQNCCHSDEACVLGNQKGNIFHCSCLYYETDRKYIWDPYISWNCGHCSEAQKGHQKGKTLFELGHSNMYNLACPPSAYASIHNIWSDCRCPYIIVSIIVLERIEKPLTRLCGSWADLCLCWSYILSCTFCCTPAHSRMTVSICIADHLINVP